MLETDFPGDLTDGEFVCRVGVRMGEDHGDRTVSL